MISLFPSVLIGTGIFLHDAATQDQIDSKHDENLSSQARRVLVSCEQFPDQSIYTLEQQLLSLNQSMARLKFYLSDLDDLLPR